MTATGQILPIPAIAVAASGMAFSDPPAEILPWQPDHGTMEQYQSVVKTAVDLERLPSKSANNQLVLDLAFLTDNLLRVIGPATLDCADLPRRKAAPRRRTRTVIQTLDAMPVGRFDNNRQRP